MNRWLGADKAREIAYPVAAFVCSQVVPFEHDRRCGGHGPSDEMVEELRERARAAGVLTPHILQEGSHVSHREARSIGVLYDRIGGAQWCGS
jgi:acyl-CoA dehydrogenase